MACLAAETIAHYYQAIMKKDWDVYRAMENTLTVGENACYLEYLLI